MQSGNLAAQLVAAALLAPSACQAQDTADTNTVTVTLHASVNSLGVFQAEADVAATGAWSAPYREASSHRPADLLSPELFGGFLTKGQQGDLDAAQKAYERQISINPRDPYAYNNLGLLQERQGRWDAAIESFRMQLRVHAGDSGATSNLPRAL
jgi:tetratricopeptide (TPR) repeat protein